MKFSKKVYEKLIDKVRQRPALYNCKLKEHKDQQLQRNIWKSIAAEMGVTNMSGEDWKKMWRQKRDAFIRKLRELKKSGPEATDIPKGPLFDDMLFLSDYIWQKNTRSSSLTPDTDSLLDDDPAMVMKFGLRESSIGFVKSETSASNLSRSGTPTNGEILQEREVGDDESADELPQIVGKKWPVGTQKAATKNTFEREYITGLHEIAARSKASSDSLQKILELHSNQQDKDDNIFCFLAKKFNRFSASTQEWLEDEVMKLFMEAKRRDRNISGKNNTAEESKNTSHLPHAPSTSYSSYS